MGYSDAVRKGYPSGGGSKNAYKRKLKTRRNGNPSNKGLYRKRFQ